MERKVRGKLQTDSEGGGLKELVLRWFSETQVALILIDGNVPDWFHGFAARKDAEDLLRDKAVGCFLIRLSDKAIGYILSYRGLDRCRHFVITQNQDGHFIISGDSQSHHSVTELIEHYKVSPILPFGEYLTSSCSQESTEELYDVVNYTSRDNSGVSVQALRTLWDQKNPNHRDAGHQHSRTQQTNNSELVPQPALPPKTKVNRRLMATVSVDEASLAQVAPAVPKRGTPLGFPLSKSLPETSLSERRRGNTSSFRNFSNFTNTSSAGNPHPHTNTWFSLTGEESRGTSLQSPSQLDVSSVAEEDEKELNMKIVTCQCYSLHEPQILSSSSSRQTSHGGEVEMLRSNPLYQITNVPGWSVAQQGDVMYTDIPMGGTLRGQPDYTYEEIPEEGRTPTNNTNNNTYESVDDMTKKSKSTLGKKNINWKKFLPEYKKKY